MIHLTENAVKQVKTLLEKQNTPGYGLRVGIQGGGCAGLSYQFTFDEKPNESDKVIEQDGVKVFVDNKSYLFLNGMEIDYHSDLMSSGFKFNNPNAKSSCGCGTSFSLS
ncbi:MAG: iron-sulfur cluster insertion protein ErpA [Deltaproteobacteria bacterium]|nr:iron-sulfur cluster insertion protein ErpA [Deltaproteobacteria bacterium]